MPLYFINTLYLASDGKLIEAVTLGSAELVLGAIHRLHQGALCQHNQCN